MLIGSTSYALPVILYQHNGSTDPSSEAWTPASFTAGTSAGPISDNGTAAWSITNSAPAETGFYKAVPTAAEVSTAASGWSLKLTLDVTAANLSPGGSMLSLYRDGSTSYQMHFGSDASGNVLVVLSDGVSSDGTSGAQFTLAGGTGLNTFELLYSPGANSANLFVNGVLRLSSYTGFALTSAHLVGWGDGSSRPQATNISAANYSNVTFSVVPEPSTAGLLVAGGILAFVLQRLFRRRRTA